MGGGHIPLTSSPILVPGLIVNLVGFFINQSVLIVRSLFIFAFASREPQSPPQKAKNFNSVAPKPFLNGHSIPLPQMKGPTLTFQNGSTTLPKTFFHRETYKKVSKGAMT